MRNKMQYNKKSIFFHFPSSSNKRVQTKGASFFFLVFLFFTSSQAFASRAFIQTPDYDFGWVTISPGSAKNIPLPVNVKDRFLYCEQRDSSSPGLGINHAYYGGMNMGAQELGSYWDNTHGQTLHLSHMVNGNVADQQRIRIYSAKTTLAAQFLLNLLD